MVFRKGLVFVVSGTTISSQNIEICSFYSRLSVKSKGPHSASTALRITYVHFQSYRLIFWALSKCEYTIGIALKFCTSLYPISYVSDENLKNLIYNFFFSCAPPTPHIPTFSHSELFFELWADMNIPLESHCNSAHDSTPFRRDQTKTENLIWDPMDSGPRGVWPDVDSGDGRAYARTPYHYTDDYR